MTTSAERLVVHEPRLAGFVRGGRLHKIPRKTALAGLLYAAVADELPTDVVMSETEVNNHLRSLYDDVATLRRALVDHGHLRRTADGRSYRRPQVDSPSPTRHSSTMEG